MLGMDFQNRRAFPRPALLSNNNRHDANSLTASKNCPILSTVSADTYGRKPDRLQLHPETRVTQEDKQPPTDPATPDESVESLFEKAVANHSRRLLAIARAIVGTRASPEDVVQQAVTNLFQHRHRYDWREPGGLLKRAVVNESLRLLRHPRMSMVGEEHPDRTERPIDEMEQNETVRRVREAIGRLPDHFRAALVLCEYDGLSYQQIADTLNASVPQVKTWIFRARRQVEAQLKDYVEKNNLGANRGE
jgi:RNA polymerase sigma-70 factor (ECF subfamily)